MVQTLSSIDDARRGAPQGMATAPDVAGATTSEVSRLCGLSERAVRLYDERGLVRVRRDGSNYRRFSRADCSKLRLIALLREAGVQLGAIDAAFRSANAECAPNIAKRLLEVRQAELLQELARVRELSRQLPSVCTE
jgi:DNA-binding transcriptional MerR regulator